MYPRLLGPTFRLAFYIRGREVENISVIPVFIERTTQLWEHHVKKSVSQKRPTVSSAVFRKFSSGLKRSEYALVFVSTAKDERQHLSVMHHESAEVSEQRVTTALLTEGHFLK